MDRVVRLSEEVSRSLQEALPKLRKTIVRKLSLAVALPLETRRLDMREQWLRRLLKNPLIEPGRILEPFARAQLVGASSRGQTLQLLMDQTQVGKGLQMLMLALRVGNRAVPLAWLIEATHGGMGWPAQQAVLEQVRAWIPHGASVMLLADRFYPSAALLRWLQAQGWHYRLRLRGNLLVDVGEAGIETAADLARIGSERFVPRATLFEEGIATAIGVVHEPGHPEPWIIALDATPQRASVLDYGARWAIEPLFSDFKSRGFRLEDTHLREPRRLSCLVLIMTLALYWCVQTGRAHATQHPTALEKKPVTSPQPDTTACARPPEASCRGSSAAYACC